MDAHKKFFKLRKQFFAGFVSLLTQRRAASHPQTVSGRAKIHFPHTPFSFCPFALPALRTSRGFLLQYQINPIIKRIIFKIFAWLVKINPAPSIIPIGVCNYPAKNFFTFFIFVLNIFSQAITFSSKSAKCIPCESNNPTLPSFNFTIKST
jgi:hypothetical protein